MKLIFIVLAVSFLAACNGESGGGSSGSIEEPTPEPIDIEVLPVQSKSRVNESTRIEVSAESDIGTDLHLASVISDSYASSCQVISVDGLAFTTLSDQIGECQYQYTVEPVNSDVYIGQKSSIVRVSVSDTASDNTLPNLSETTDVEKVVTIDLTTALEHQLDTSTYRVSEEITILGSGSAESDIVNNTITFTPSEVGVTRVMYSMGDGSSTKLGNIDVAVSDVGNTTPVANDYIREGKLAKDMSVEIDLTDYVSDAEDSVLLDSVRAYNSETEIISATEHIFTFRSSEPGPHEVAYTVKDGHGGYAVGQVYIEVEPDFSLVQDWEDITIYDPKIGTDITFTGPVSKVLADYTNTAYTSYQIQDGVTGPKQSNAVTMSLQQAQTYCASRNGRLPISREWDSLMADQGNLFESKNWPAGTPFWIADMVSEIAGKSINAINGNTSELTKLNGEGFATCVLLEDELINDFSTKIESENAQESHLEHFLSFYVLDPDGNSASFQDIKAEVRAKKGVFSNGLSSITLATDSSGEVSDIYRDTSLNNAVLSTVVSSDSEDSVVIQTAVDEMYIDSTDPTLWNIAEVLQGGSFWSIDEQGIPLHYRANTISEVTAVHKNSYVGRDVVARYRLKANNVPSISSGKLNFVLQQFGSSPNTKDWGYTNAYQEGLPHASAVISNEINYYSQNITTIVGNSHIGGQTSKFISLPTRFEYWYVWIIIQDDTLLLYTNTSDERPKEPTFSIANIWEDIDPSQPYWVGFGGTPSPGAAEDVSIYVNAVWMGSGGN